jgi:hypothetical protein
VCGNAVSNRALPYGGGGGGGDDDDDFGDDDDDDDDHDTPLSLHI